MFRHVSHEFHSLIASADHPQTTLNRPIDAPPATVCQTHVTLQLKAGTFPTGCSFLETTAVDLVALTGRACLPMFRL